MSLFIAPDGTGHPTLWQDDPERPGYPIAIASKHDCGPILWGVVTEQVAAGHPDPTGEWQEYTQATKRLANACKCGDCCHPSFGPDTDGEPCDWCRGCGCPSADHDVAEPSVPVSEIEALAERLAADADTRLRGMAAKWARDTSYDLRALVAAAKGGGDR